MIIDGLKDIIQYAEVKQLVDNLMSLQREKKFHSLAVLSTLAGEGKTLFCAAVALAYAEMHRSRVLLVDTTTYRGPRSLSLRACLDPCPSLIDLVFLEEYRKNGHVMNVIPAKEKVEAGGATQLRTEPSEDLVVISAPTASDQSILQLVVQEEKDKYELILLDTAPLASKNKSNIDPWVVARTAEAAVLLASQHLLNAPELGRHLKLLDDPALHLIGVVANEDFLP
jgi:Mrp family chromosome partitioning ATPase